MTKQEEFWVGEFGNQYVDRNNINLNELCKEYFGISQIDLNTEFLYDVPFGSSFLEVGCNIGKQLLILERMGYTHLNGVEINEKAVKLAKENKGLNIKWGSAFGIPFSDNKFDVVFTIGVLIHIHPNDLNIVIDEMYRVSKEYIWCFEYFSEECEEINYRGNEEYLWKNNFLKLFMERHPDLKIVKQKKLKYLNDENIDMMFLLQKGGKDENKINT